MSAFSPQNIANIAWAFAKLRKRHVDVFNAISDYAVCTDYVIVADRRSSFRYLLPGLKPNYLTMLACAFAHLGLHATTLFEMIGNAFAKDPFAFNPQNTALLAWAFAKAGVHSDHWFAALSRRSLASLVSFSAQNLSNLAWAFAVNGFRDAALFDEIQDQVTARLREFSPQEACNMLWAFAISGEAANHPDFFRQTVRATWSALGNTAQSSELAQMFQCHLAYMLFSDEPLLDSSAYKICKAAFTRRNSKFRESSCLEDQVGEVVVRIIRGRGQLEREATVGEGLSVDIAVRLNGQEQPIAIEVQGPKHFMVNSPTHMDGRTRFKIGVLRSQGWRVISVPFLEWSSRSSVERELHLRREIFGSKLRS
eukprot:c15547_g1_i2.p1 GENE.c15547_g1_i2~~c15547_g1_i2.p1  ORF type:complete len:367 (+),score=58.91 c15547_g1_i2:303-1403(+)